MAELPDLTVFAQILTRKFKGKVLEKIDVTVAKKLNVSGAELKKTLEHKTLVSVKREGKTLQLHFSGEQVLRLHLMLRGELVELEVDGVPRFQIVAFHFEDGSGFAVIDMQKQATPTLNPEPVSVRDALEMEEKYFVELLARKKTLIKVVLMDQKVIRGIGNSYADEILYDAGVSPFSNSNAIPEKSARHLFKSLQKVLKKAIEDIAEANGDTLSGELKDFMAIHKPRLEKTSRGEMIKTEKIGGRTTYYTDKQELFN